MRDDPIGLLISDIVTMANNTNQPSLPPAIGTIRSLSPLKITTNDIDLNGSNLEIIKYALQNAAVGNRVFLYPLYGKYVLVGRLE